MFEQRINKFEGLITERLIQVGKLFVKNARENGQYGNQTFNLRSSIAFAVIKHGNIIHEDYKKFGNGSEGLQKAKDLIEELAGKKGDGFSLIAVAGMEYASIVESQGKDVITGSSQIAKSELKKAIREIKKLL